MHRRRALQLLAGAVLSPGATRPLTRSSSAVQPHVMDNDTRPGRAPSRSRSPSSLDTVGIQLYTVRHDMERDFEGTLAGLAEIGYREVEFAGFFGRSPAAVRTALASAGLEGPASHVPAATVVNETERTLDETAAAGCRYLVAAWIDADQRQSPDDWNRWADRFNRTGEGARERGLRFAYHNHNYEFPATGGVVPYDVLLAGTDASRVEFEMDLYWIISAGRDPLAYFARHPGRFPLVHVKDSLGPPDHRMVDVGRGTIDFVAIFGHREQAGIRHWFVEHDEPESALQSARVSYDYMRRLRAP